MISMQKVNQIKPTDQFLEEQLFIEETQSNNKNLINTKKIQGLQLPIKKQKGQERNLKNFPKLIGNNLCKYATYNSSKHPKGIQEMIKKKTAHQQVGFKIADLRQVCLSDGESQKLFQIYLKNQLLLDLIYSPKINDPLAYITGICNYYAASFVPQKMVGSYIIK
ncbi:unnamed protein product (macronuclear) [Paramecium tetraurelia]|uniref:Uncharacterized protein n=1 Tax=Paramecium tetraurelia TaxID=5888 RepID=A0EEJ8_PARTE|nr:uncharacterized protein GSPATT00026061001 [Paramecium tetraurelia]CAK93730.1 unnamed protein product [Paramecium tetraurelia]|eukprot:XP_001461112.1 hypothetical protein (macronuclear) [Paramecium tetraurelia strain d4-2]